MGNVLKQIKTEMQLTRGDWYRARHSGDTATMAVLQARLGGLRAAADMIVKVGGAS